MQIFAVILVELAKSEDCDLFRIKLVLQKVSVSRKYKSVSRKYKFSQEISTVLLRVGVLAGPKLAVSFSQGGGGGVLAMFVYGGVHAMFLGLKFHLKVIFGGSKICNMNFLILGGKKFQQLSFLLDSILWYLKDSLLPSNL